MTDRKKQCLKWISEIQAIAQSGLTFTKNPFDQERFLRLQELMAEATASCTDYSFDEVKELFTLQKGYATPKLDVRSFVIKDNKVLMVKERADGLWSLPGGWSDVNESPSEAAARETLEETGYIVRPVKLLALWDKLKHDHPLQWPHAYKSIFYCEIVDKYAFEESVEIMEIDFFDKNALPALSLDRITSKQIIILFDLLSSDVPTQFD